MDDTKIRQLLQTLGKKRRRVSREAERIRKDIHEAALQASAAGWNNQQIAEQIGVTREIIRRHVGPHGHEEVGRGEQERS